MVATNCTRVEEYSIGFAIYSRSGGLEKLNYDRVDEGHVFGATEGQPIHAVVFD